MYILHSHCTCHRKSFAFLISKHLSKSEEQTSLTLVRFFSLLPASSPSSSSNFFSFICLRIKKKIFIQWFMFGVAKTKLNANLCNEMCGFPFRNFIFVYNEKNCDHYITHISFTNPILFYFLCFILAFVMVFLPAESLVPFWLEIYFYIGSLCMCCVYVFVCICYVY